MSEDGFRVIIDDFSNLPICFDCEKKFKHGDIAIIYLINRVPKIRCLDCHNNIVVDCVNGAGEQVEKPNF